VKLATGSLEGATTGGNAVADAGSSVDQNRLDPDVADLCEHYEIEDRIMYILNDAMKERQETFDGGHGWLVGSPENGQKSCGLAHGQD